MSSHSLDVLYRRVARKVLTETLGMKKGEALTVETWNNGSDFAGLVVAEARAMGCTALTVFEDEDAYVEGVRRAPKDSLGLMGKNEYGLLAGTDAYVFVPGQALSPYSRILTPAELEDSTMYNSSWYDAAAKAKLRGARLAFGYVGKNLARMLGNSIEKIVKGQLEAALTDYGEVSRRAANLASKLSDGSATTIEAGGSSLRFSLRGYLEIEDGLVDEKDLAEGNNMTYIPPGFVTKELEPGSVEGKLKVSATLTRYGLLAGAELEFKNGVLIGWKGEDRGILKKLLDPIPEEKRKLTVLGIGTNPAMRYGLGQDRFVGGAVFLGGLGFNLFVRKATVSAAGNLLVSKGVLRS